MIKLSRDLKKCNKKLSKEIVIESKVITIYWKNGIKETIKNVSTLDEAFNKLGLKDEKAKLISFYH